jgi:DNA modification methylase
MTDAPLADSEPMTERMKQVRRDLTVRRVPIVEIHHDPANARLHGERNLATITSSLKEFGQVEPLVVQKGTGKVIGGNGRLTAMIALGWTSVDIVEVEASDIKAAMLGIALNRTAELAEWDDAALGTILKELQAEDMDLEVAGFDGDELEDLLAETDGAADGDDEGPGEPPAIPVSKRGEIYELGPHRLMCGDSTSREDVIRLLGGEKAKLCATDPPYLVDYTGVRPGDSGKDWSGVYHEIDIKDADGFFTKVFENVLVALDEHSAIYCWHADKRAPDFRRVWDKLGILMHQCIIWVKPSSVLGHVFWHYRHEPCLMGWKQGSKPAHDGGHDHNSVWDVDWEGKARFTGSHPTTKPVELFARPIRKHTRPGDLCFEPFSGSGSQLIAAAKEGRRCYAIEIEPAFVDVARRRWTKFARSAGIDPGPGALEDPESVMGGAA